MAKDGQGTPIVDEPSGAEPTAERLSERASRIDAAQPPGATAYAVAVQPVPLHQAGEVSMLRPGGRMVIGSRAPVPGPAAAGAAAGDGSETQLFSSARDGRRAVSGGAAVALACAVAVGSTAVLTTALNDSFAKHGGARSAGPANSGSGAGQDAPSLAAMAPSHAQPQATQVASLSPVAIPQRLGGGNPLLIRVAKKDAAGFAVDNVTGPAGAQLPVKVEVTQDNPEEYSFLMFRGLPAEVSLSAGFRLKDSWAVSLRDLENLALTSPADYEGSFEVEVLLIKGRSTPADSRVIIVDIRSEADVAAPDAVAATAPQEAPAPRILTAAPPEPTPVEAEQQVVAAPRAPAAPTYAAPAPQKMDISPEMEASMLDRATRMLSNGDVSGARLLFEHVAKRGSGKAAMALARTYDPIFFDSIDTRGLRPSAELAKQWYAIAAELGQDEARSRLGALTSGR